MPTFLQSPRRTEKGTCASLVFEKTVLSFVVEGAVEAKILIEAVQFSQTKYCGVSAMLSKSFPIEYRIILNGSEVGTGAAKFESHTVE